MNVGDTVVHVDSIGTIVGVSTGGAPVIQWAGGVFEECHPDNLIIMVMPEPAEELKPEVAEELKPEVADGE
jgi:hypothetical protein